MTGVEAYRRAPPSINNKVSNTRARQQQPPTASDGIGRLKTERGALITSSLPSLQNLIKRSPESYAEEFSAQWSRFGSLVKIVQLGLGGTKADEDKLREVTGFICQVRALGHLNSTSRKADRLGTLSYRWHICILPLLDHFLAHFRLCCWHPLQPRRLPTPLRQALRAVQQASQVEEYSSRQRHVKQ